MAGPGGESRYSSAVHAQTASPQLLPLKPAPGRVAYHRLHFWPTGCHWCPQTGHVGPFFFLPIMVSYTRPGRTTGSASPLRA